MCPVPHKISYGCDHLYAGYSDLVLKPVNSSPSGQDVEKITYRNLNAIPSVEIDWFQ